MTKNKRPATPPKSTTENVEGFEVAKAGAGETADSGVVQAAETGTPPPIQPTPLPGDAIAAQLAAKTDEDVARQAGQHLQPTTENVEDTRDPVALALVEVEKEIGKADDVKKAFDLLKQVETLTAETKLEKRIKEAAIVRIKKHCFDIQQGGPLVNIGANELAGLPGLKTAGIQAERIELRARGDNDIKTLLQRIAELENKTTEKE